MNKVISQATLGIILTLSFVLLESGQFVYFGGLFQRISPLLFGFLVFGTTTIGLLIWTRWMKPAQWKKAMAEPGLLLAVNLGAVVTFLAYLISVQLVEPAITYTISAGMMPITAYVLYRMGFREGEAMRNRFETIGNLLIFLSIAYLVFVTIAGYSGFVRGGQWSAIAGVTLAALDGIFFTLILVYSQRLSKLGIGSSAVLGLRLPLYVLVSGVIAIGGGTYVGLPPWLDMVGLVVIGILLTIPSLYLLQKAVPLLSTLTLSALTALGPFAVFGLQLIEGRVDYALGTLAGLVFYSVGAVCSALGAVRGATAS